MCRKYENEDDADLFRFSYLTTFETQHEEKVIKSTNNGVEDFNELTEEEVRHVGRTQLGDSPVEWNLVATCTRYGHQRKMRRC